MKRQFLELVVLPWGDTLFSRALSIAILRLCPFIRCDNKVCSQKCKLVGSAISFTINMPKKNKIIQGCTWACIRKKNRRLRIFKIMWKISQHEISVKGLCWCGWLLLTMLISRLRTLNKNIQGYLTWLHDFRIQNSIVLRSNNIVYLRIQNTLISVY